MKANAYLNGQHFNNFLLTPLDMRFTKDGNPITEAICEADIPEKLSLIPFNYVPKGDRTDSWVHFYIQDYLFDRIWNSPRKYLEMLKRHPGVIGPDFSKFWDTPLPIQKWSHYKKKWLEAYYQLNGLKVIPNIGWSDVKSYDWCFDGEPRKSVISISANGCMQERFARSLFYRGYEEAQERLQPCLILMHCPKGFVNDIQAETHYPVRFIHYEFRKR